MFVRVRAIHVAYTCAVDAFAVADLAGGAVIATVDTDDMIRLAGAARSNITIASIG
jgi:hypothetical protein